MQGKTETAILSEPIKELASGAIKSADGGNVSGHCTSKQRGDYHDKL